MKIQISDVKGVLSKEPGISLYYQVEKYLSDKIRSGEWRVGDQIPTEQELSEKLKVSRATVRLFSSSRRKECWKESMEQAHLWPARLSRRNLSH